MPTIEVAEHGDLTPVAAWLCDDAQPGAVIHLFGPIGAGKTTLVQSCARRLGVAEPVTSPTFALAHRYVGRLPVAHLDLYRLAETSQGDPGDLLTYLDEDAIAFVEWPELGGDWLPEPSATVTIDVRENGTRRFRLDR